MSNENDIFYRFSPFIRDFIYRHEWESLRSVQLEAAKVLFETEENLTSNDKICLQYVNRLSDFLFVLSKKIAKLRKNELFLWEK